MGTYVLKWGQEAIWAIVVAAIGAVAATIAGIPLDQLLSEPTVVAGVIAAAVSRAVLAVVWNQISKLQGG